ncbi:helicase RepA family protein [Intestinimonas timonensis]|uniref:helicase RepA family protein n=1 Tax=Intestinimonas timonensis TaxID=1689270 RepID=UPI003A92F902
MKRICLLDLNYTLVGNQADTRMLRPFSRRMAAEEYRADLIEAIKDDYVIIVTARPDYQMKQTMENIKRKTGWQPQEWYFNDINGEPPVFKESALQRFIFPKHGSAGSLYYHVSMGLPLWGYPVHKGTVLYLALEDDHRRLQGRLYRMFGMDGTNDLLFAIYAKQLGLGLEEQLKKFVRQHPDTKLIIIDTLQKVREVGGDKYSYANDYEVVGKLKRLADDCGICLLLVHHTRKQQADDKFDMISGTNGLLGAADGAFLLQKEKRTDGSAILDVAGRDQQDQRMYLTKDKERLVWELERLETEPWVEPPDPVLEAVAALVTADSPTWGGTATELAAALQTDMKPNALAMRLNVRAGRLAAEYHIRYENSRSHAGRSITLTLEPPQA